MSRIKHSVCWWCLPENNQEPRKWLRTLADIGYEGIELIDEEFWPLMKEYGLTIASMRGHALLEHGLNRREHHVELEKEIRDTLRLAEQWNIPNLIVFSGNRDGLDDQSGAEITAEGLSRVAKDAEDAGVTLVLELLNSKVDHKDYQCDHTAWGVEVCRMVNSPRVKLLYDIYHMQIMEGDLIRAIRDQHDYFGHYHTAGNPGRHEIDESQEINYAPIMQIIAQTGYEGYVGQEFIPTGDPVLALQRAFDICNVS